MRMGLRMISVLCNIIMQLCCPQQLDKTSLRLRGSEQMRKDPFMEFTHSACSSAFS